MKHQSRTHAEACKKQSVWNAAQQLNNPDVSGQVLLTLVSGDRWHREGD